MGHWAGSDCRQHCVAISIETVFAHSGTQQPMACVLLHALPVASSHYRHPLPTPSPCAARPQVSETFLRCIKMRFDQTNAVIELNALKIAEDRTFADCARYIFTTMLGLCLPAPEKVRAGAARICILPMDVLCVNEDRLAVSAASASWKQ